MSEGCAPELIFSMKFEPIEKTAQERLAPYFAAQTRHMGDFSLAFLFMWNDALRPAYAIVENCLVLREYFGGKCYYHYPLSRTNDREEERRAVLALEAEARRSCEHLHFTNVPKDAVPDMVASYAAVLLTNNRRWRDYLYAAEDFKTYPGKAYAGQRNHVRKFASLYPDWSFSKASPSDMGAMEAFLLRYDEVQRAKGTYLAREELDEAHALLPHLERFGLLAGILRVGDTVVGLSVGERCGDMIVVHIEKALREYEGAYPFLAQQFARTFCGDGVGFLNRMDDAGDLGLRKSKLQYHPVMLVDKYNVFPKRALEGVTRIPRIATERLVLKRLRDEDAAVYARLASDEARNRYWGYDWHEDYEKDASGEAPSAEYFLYCAREEFRHRREMSLGIYADGVLAGEAVLHNFGYRAEAEVGVRLLPEFEGMGYASEAVRALCDYAFSSLNIERMEAKCYIENARSRAMLVRAGLRECGKDDTFYRFFRTPEM